MFETLLSQSQILKKSVLPSILQRSNTSGKNASTNSCFHHLVIPDFTFLILLLSAALIGCTGDDSIITAVHHPFPGPINTAKISACGPNQFLCEDQFKCIEKSQVCDLSLDCYDGSDEHANCTQVPCKQGTFQCQFSKRCIPAGWLCDGTSDCGFTEGYVLDQSDEHNCNEDQICQKNFFKCRNGISCVMMVNVCNGIPECPDGSDEDFCKSSQCSDPEAKKCKYGCKPTREGPQCYCPFGKEFDGTGCIDANQCSMLGACDQLCTPGKTGKKQCHCVDGYIQNGSHCQAVNVPPDAAPVILYQDATDIKWIHLNGSDVKGYPAYKSPQHSGILGLDFDHLQGTVCWINHDNVSSVMRCANSKNLGRYEEMRQPYLYSFRDVYKMAFDWISQNYYFVDDAREIIFVCRKGLDMCRTVIDTDLSKPRGLAIDPTAGYMFFTVWGTSRAGLDRALLDGTERTTLVSKKIVYPYGVAVDLPARHIYWVDKFLDFVERADYDGTNRRTIYRGIQHLQDITVFENYLYLISWQQNQIISLSKFQEAMSNKTIKVNDKKPLLAIHVYHRQRQPRVRVPHQHPCLLTHKCNEFCFPMWHNETGVAKCGCREGFQLQVDGKSCAATDKSAFIIFSNQKTGIMKSFSLRSNIDKNMDVMVPVMNRSQNLAFDYDSRTSTLYYSDRGNFRILKKGLTATNEEIFIDKGVSFVEGIAVDWMGQNLFWTDENLNTIYVASLRNPQYKKLLAHANLTSPKSIAVDPKHGYVYWSNYAKSHERDGSIERMWMDGSHRENLLTNLGWPIGLNLDHENELLYYSDALAYTLERIRVSGTKLEKEILFTANTTTQGHPTDVAYFNGTIYMVVNGEIRKAAVFPTPMKSWPTPEINWETVKSHEIANIKVFDGSLQGGSSKCSGEHGCPQLCLAIPVNPGSVCVCEDGYDMSSSGQTCEKISNYTHPLACDGEEFECRKFPKCIKEGFVCNDLDDCGDGSDEDTGPEGKCANMSQTCGRNSFHCGKGVCILSSAVCDGKPDCLNGKDESHVACTTRDCLEDEVMCRVSKRCIPKSWKCDGEMDCGEADSSDEEDCQYPECSPTQYQCQNKSCIPLESLCDGVPDCVSGEDEGHCEQFCSRMQMFFCQADNKCMNSTQKCDGQCQCSDGEDEIDCKGDIPPCARGFLQMKEFRCESELTFLLTPEECMNISCGANTFRCHDGTQCIPHGMRCDGRDDCQDASDESNCPTKVVKCNYPNRTCDRGAKCVPVRQICNLRPDCEDKSDEGPKCSEDPCGRDRVANCSHSCQKTPEGHICYCPENMHLLQSDKSTCVEDHPCDQWGTCSQECKKIGKRHACFCLPGYALKEDGVTCKSIHTDIPHLVFSNRHELREINLHQPTSFNSLISNLRNSIALDFYHQDNTYQIFWTDVVDDRIYKGSLNGGSLINIDIVIQTGLATAEGLAVDWIGENLYWVESNLDQIEVAKLNGSFRKTLISGQMFAPRSIALDPQIGVLFWTDWEADDPRIERASMSGDYRSIVFKVGMMGEGAWPNGLTLDYTKHRIYWVDARLDSIHTIKYDGSDFRTILSDHEALSHPFAISVFESNLYWTDWRSNSVMRANKFTGGNVTTIQKTYTQPFDVKIFHPSRQPKNFNNPCGENNGGCSHLCLLSINRTFACGCPHLMALGPDNRTCIANEKMLLFSRLNEIRAVYLDKLYYHAAPPISLPLIVSPANLHFVAKYKQIYWCDAQSGETKRANISSPPIETLIDGAAGKPLAIGVDWISDLIFIAVQNPLRNSISVTNLNGEYFTTIIQGKHDLKNINSIAVNPHKAQIYWPEGNSKSQFSIQMAQMDGSKRISLANSREHTSLENPVSLSYDFTSDRLYWVNYNTERIQYYDFKSKSVETISFGNLKPNVITVYHNYIYFASEKLDAILRGDKTKGVDYEFVRNNTENIYSIRVYDPDEQNGTNPCSVNKGGCQHLCLPVSSSKRVCRCALGYGQDEQNPTKCKSKDTVIVYVDSSGIKGGSTDMKSNEDLLVPIPLVSFATDIDVDENNEYLYWLDNDKGRISRIKRDGTGRETVLKDLEAATGLAIDWNAGNMYWANPKDSMIEVAHVNGSSHYVLITENLNKPMSLAVDPEKGYLFWSDIAKGVIERTNLDGSNRKVVVHSEPMWVADIALDMENERVYWCDSANDKIESATYDGESRMAILSEDSKSHLHSPLIDNGTLYWIDMGHQGGSIMSASVNNIEHVTPGAIRESLGVTMKDLGIFSTRRQKGRNACGRNNGGCQDLCLYNGTHPVCICAHGKIGADGRSCKPYDAFLAFSRVSSIETIHISEEVTPNAPYPAITSSDHIRNAIGLAYDFKNHRMFYSDVQLGRVISVYFNGSNFSVIAEKQGSVEGLYYEAADSDLYWTCSNDASINRINPYLPGAKVEKIMKLSSQDKPRGIAVDPCESRIYWTNWDMNKPSIQRAYMSGFGVESIITSEIRMPNGLTLDHPARKLYWVDARLDKIERSELDGSGRKVIASEKPKHAFSIAVLGDYIYWSDWVLHSVMRAEKYSGENVQTLRTDILKPMGIVAVSKQDEACLKNPCNILNGGCAEICSLDEYGHPACKCHPGKTLQDNGRCVVEPVNRANCTANEFRCTAGSCIDYELTCDGIVHCPDSSDEDEKYCATRKCKEGFFQCPNDRCIKNSKRCDGIADCQSKEDEVNCTCTSDQFRCVKDGRCINNADRCNKFPDCLDASDEMNCGKVDCPKNISDSSMEFHQCPHTTACYHKSWECDGANDCWDNSDESNCTDDIVAKSKKDCHPNSFSCGDGTCILRAWMCDMDVDCENGNDEKNCHYTCKPQQFVCHSGECISLMWKCDGSHDCSDGSDEGEQCTEKACDDNKQFKCNSTGRCIPNQYLCDGDVDCQDGEDENPPDGCSNITRSGNVLGICSPHQFPCKNGLCLSPEWVCDNEKDCQDGEDEENCPGTDKCDENNSDGQPCIPVSCGPFQFKCNNGRCISSTRKCNGMNDCGDLSDESDALCGKDCSAETEFLCKNNVCVNETLLCNGQNDCGDSSDEIGCGINECDNPQEELKVCQHTCVDKKVGYQCKCWNGFKPSPTNANLCVDVNECDERACSQKCKNSLGSYRCSCLPNYILKEDGHSCKANSNEPVKLLLSNQYYIRMVDHSGATTLLAHNLTNAVALDYDWLGGCIYFSDVTAFGSSIKRLCIPSKNSSDIKSDAQLQEETLHYITVQSPDGLAVDWIGKNLYWCDKGTDTIEVSRLDGKFRKVLIHERLQEPRGIALDPLHGQLFWTDWGDEPYIGRAGMDGSNFRILISENLGWPNALTISHETNELFWADAKEDYIAVSDLNGENRKIIHSRAHNPTAKVHHIFAITTFEDMIWWSDWETKSVEKCHKYTGYNESRVTTTIHRPMDVKVFHPFRQPPRTPNPCENRGGCHTLCLLSPDGGAVCACPENFILTENQRNCTNNCTSSQFECKQTLKCIPSWWQCDGQNDCSSEDHSDEPESCPPFNCTPGQFQCKSGECIHPASLCDAKDDCQDASDEVECEKHTCFGTQFKCEANGTGKAFCIPQTHRCDGKPDCPNGQDEVNCQSKQCPANQFLCQNKKCIQPEWTCDMEDDCGDGSDENPQINCTQRSCDANKFRCRSGKCIPSSWRCDGEKDCSEGEDEPKACSDPDEHRCEPTYFRCENHRCIPSRWYCDYDDDCGDNSDEINCQPRNCSESEWRCSDGRCIRNTLRCNGEYNCQDHSDEQNCNTTCTPQDFVCENPKFCIFGGWRCDGDADCMDGSDELNCGNKTGCHHDQFKCNNGECLSLSWRCDGEKDCADGSDEDVDLCKNTLCESGKFRCRSNNICIPYSKTCDGENDCQDGSDEQLGMCPQKRNQCNKEDQFQCANSHKCINATLVCDSQNDCLDGSDETDCIPCTFGSCSHTCVVKKHTGPMKHNFTCECADGFRMSHVGNRSACQATDEDAFMLLATENQMLKANPSKPLADETEVLMTDTAFHSKVESLDYLLEAGGVVRIFYTAGSRRSIQELQIPLQTHTNSLSRLEKREAVPPVKDVITGLDEPKGIAVDWVAKRIYWLDSGHRTLSVSTLDGKTRLVLINKGLVEPFEIVVDPESGRMFWSDWTDQRIGVAFMDGSGKKTLVQSPCPMGLAIDYPARRLYWTDVKSHTVETVTLDGRDRRVVKRFKGGNTKPNKIDVFEDWVYLTTYNLDKIFRMDKFGRDEPTQWLQGASNTIIVQSHKKRQLSNPCDKIICPHPGLCLLSGNNTVSCACPGGKGIRSSSNSTHDIFTCKSATADKCDLKCKQGHCVIEQGVPKCVCNPLYEGLLCEVYRCSGYCLNKGMCYQDLMAVMNFGAQVPLKCDCPQDFTGERCQTPVVSCKGLCNNNGKCNETTNICSCEKPYSGRLCDSCDKLRCDNGGVCKLDSKNSPACHCQKGFSGSRCDKSVCDNYCSNKGKCKVKNGSPECTSCSPGFKGVRCEEDVCQRDLVCLHGGRCEHTVNGVGCVCNPPYVGVMCEYNLCECPKCTKSASCQCPPNVNNPQEYCNGTDSSLINRCKSSFCKHGGKCLVVNATTYCRCPDAWVGARCEISAPANKPCQSYCLHGGICIMLDVEEKPECRCFPGWTGSRCELKTECTSNFCVNGGTCVPVTNESLPPVCSCPPGFYGLRCESRMKTTSEISGSEDSGVTWVLVLVFIVVAVSVAGLSGCMAYVVMRRKQYGFNRGRPFMHVRMHDAGTVEINNPMFLKEEGDEDHASEPSLIFDSDKVLLQGTNFANPVYETMYKEGESSTVNDEKKGLLQGEDFSSSGDHPLADPLA